MGRRAPTSAPSSSPGGPGRGAGASPSRPRPLRRYGQNHLVDTNVLAAIVRQAAVGPDDVVLEVGAADGLLTRPLLARARLVHAFEVDRRFATPLAELAAYEPRLRLHLEDALRVPLAGLDPPPTALVANLAYNIAIPLIMTTLTALPTVQRWAVMVQKELSERLFAAPGTKAYAAVSVLVQLACALEHVRPVARSAFRPRPRVDSVFLTFTRRPARRDGSWHVDGERLTPGDYEALGTLVRSAFARRRKQLATSLGEAAPGAGVAGRHGGRAAVAGALASVGAPARARPEELAPAQWVAFARALGVLARP